MLNEDLNGDDAATIEDKKKKRASKGGGTRRLGGGGTMMKCAMFDEFVDLSGKRPETEVPILAQFIHAIPSPSTSDTRLKTSCTNQSAHPLHN